MQVQKKYDKNITKAMRKSSRSGAERKKKSLNRSSESNIQQIKKSQNECRPNI